MNEGNSQKVCSAYTCLTFRRRRYEPYDPFCFRNQQRVVEGVECAYPNHYQPTGRMPVGAMTEVSE
jgi:hypothetical protein